MNKNILLVSLCIIILIAAGCVQDDIVDAQIPPPEVNIDDEDSQPQPEETPLPLAKEVKRGGEDYNYDGWLDSGAQPDCGIYVDPSWELVFKGVPYGGKWTDPLNNEAEIVYQWLIDLLIPPKEAIWQDYGDIIEKGGDVEYGEFESQYLAEAYYVKYSKNKNVYIMLYSFYYPRNVNLYQPQSIVLLSYKNRIEAEDSEATMNEEAFWKAAQSMYIAKGYLPNNEGSIPYIPEVDGDSIWDGSKQGIEPTGRQ